MKKCEILGEKWKCDTETRVSKCCWKMTHHNRLARYKAATDLQFVKKKKAISVKQNKAKHNKTKCTSIINSLRIRARFY